MTNSTRMCSRHNIPRPPRCNAWDMPCEDEGFGDDLAPAKGVVRIALACIGVWAIVLWCIT